MVYAVGPVSGCHLNPAVTLGLWMSGKFDARLAPGYVLAQLFGSLLASGILFVIAHGTGHFDATVSGFATNGFGIHSPDHYDATPAFIIEFLLTGFLMLTILGTTDIRAPVGFAGLAIGLMLTLIHLVSIPVTNTSVNPARSIGPALFVGGDAIGQLWLFILAPMLGAAVAAKLYAMMRTAFDPDAKISTKVAQQALPAEQDVRRGKAIG